jgi:hypothetical protein
MAITREQQAPARAGYRLEGSLLEACSCGVLCPCWVGEDPDGGECFAILSYHYDRGDIGGIDVGGLSALAIVHVPGNILTPHSWKLVLFIDDKAGDEQKDAIVGALSGKFGGPLADLAQLHGEVLGVESAAIQHKVEDGKGTLKIEGILDSEMEPYRSADGTITTLRDSIFSTVPGSPAYLSKQSRYKVTLPKYGMNWEYTGSNAIQADYKIEFAG